MRVHELAKQLGLSSKDMLDKLHGLGVEAKSHMAALDDAAVERARSALAPKEKKPAAAAEKKTAAAAPKKPAVPPARPAAPEKKPAAAPAAKPARAEPAHPAPVPKPAPAPAPESKPQPPPAPVAEPKAEMKPAPAETPGPPAAKVITLRGPIVVKELAEQLGLRPNQLITDLMMMNVLASINEKIDLRVAQKVAEKHGFQLEHEKKAIEHKPVLNKPGEEPETPQEKPEDMVARPPVVTFLGHVDHGKTSLLDAIRNTQVAKGEFGGITQHIGAYTVDTDGRRITFLDTPGHEAFTAMRSRGANLTDIAVIVIAADDGIMPQTTEAIKHAQAANVPIMIAINKIDLPGANVDRVKQQLAGIGLTPEDWGGSVICCPLSAVTKKGINELLEMILLQAEILELKANPKGQCRGYVVEAQLEPGMGPVVNLLVLNGTLHLGDVILCGAYWGRIRALFNDHGVKVKSVGPSTPVKCLGLSGVPNAGAEFKVCSNDKAARSQAEERLAQLKTEHLTAPKRASLGDFFKQLKDAERHELRIVLKADMQGSLEAIEHALRGIKSDKVLLNILLSGVGNITANDTLLASASDAVILGFHVAVEESVNSLAKREGVEIRLHSIIYELFDQVRDAMVGLLSPELREKIVGHATIKEVFALSKGGKVAGCLMKDGRVTSKCSARVIRGGETVYNGSIFSLRRFQNDASEAVEGQECGIRLDNFSDFAPGDVIELYEMEKIAQTL